MAMYHQVQGVYRCKHHNIKQKGNTMTTDNNGVEPTPEISEMVNDLVDMSNAMTLGGDMEPEEPDDTSWRVCRECETAINTDTDGFYQGVLPARYGWRRRDAEPDGEVFYCDECFTYCEDCDDAVLRDNAVVQDISTPSGRVTTRVTCDYCCDNYRDCDRCDDRYHSEDLVYVEEGESESWDNCSLCDGCYHLVTDEYSRVTHNYSWQPPERNFWYISDGTLQDAPNAFEFKGVRAIPNLSGWSSWHSRSDEIESQKRNLFMGFELETHNRNCPNLIEAGKFLLGSVGDGFDGEQYLYLKEDGSVSGFEIVTMPATLEAHKVLFPRAAIRALADNHGLRGWPNINGNQAGLHVHVSKASFTHSHLHKFQMFHYQNAEMLKKFAGRDSHQWASFERTSSAWGDNYKLSDLAKGDYNNSMLNRRHALNFVPQETVELRYFRSTLNPDSVIAVLEMVHAIWRYTKMNRSVDIKNNKFGWSEFYSWASRQQNYEFLIKTIDARCKAS